MRSARAGGRSASATIPLGVLTGLTASITDADTVITSTPLRCSESISARMSASSLDAGVTAAS